MFTIVQDAHFRPESDLIQDEQPHYSFYSGPPFTGVPMLNLLLWEDPIRNARYNLNAKKCAQIAQSLWLSLLPW